MTRHSRITDPAQAEIVAARDWYDAQEPALSKRFDHALYAALRKALDTPRLYPIVAGKTRKIRVGQFPYFAFFVDGPQGIVVSAVVHERRDPQIWRARA